mgnify:CR=1 FL=1
MIACSFNTGWTCRHLLEEGPAVPVTLPHDAALAEPRTETAPGGTNTGWYEGYDYLYEKRFTPDAALQGQTLVLEFEGVYHNAEVWLNGEKLAFNPYGYTDFKVDLTGKLDFDAENVLQVIARNADQPNSRWYSGAGIYRPVTLWVGPEAHLLLDGLRVRTVSIDPPEVEVTAAASAPGTVQLQVLDGTTVLASASAEAGKPVRLKLPEAALWSPEHPQLYTLQAAYGTDTAAARFGIRSLAWGREGLLLNGSRIILQGACIHHDNGILGAATLPDAEERRIRQLKEAGFNAIRSSHHPAGRALLDACDRYGVLVMDELSDVWNVRKNPYDYALYFEQDWKPTIQKMVAKDYNHPSVILYCVGNEISEAGSESGAETNRRLCNTFRELDPTRYTTNALNGLMAAGYRLREIMGDVMRKFPAQPGPSGGDGGGSNALNSFMSLMSGEKGDYFATHPLLTEALSGCEDSCDVIGLNYLTGRHVLEHELHPHKAVLGTETYPADIVRLWRIVEKNSHMIGDFTWAGYDYLGEAGCGIFHYDGGANFSSIYPERTAYIGDLDLLGNRRPISYLREIVYGLRKAPYLVVLRMEHNGQTSSKTPWMFKDNLSSWTWPGFEGQMASVDVYSASEEVELFLNGASLGRRAMVDFTATYSVPYTPGELKAVGYTGGVCDGEFTLRTAQDAQMTLTADRKTLQANGEDAAFVMIQFVDANGTADLHTKHTLKVELEGAGILEAVGSANPCSEERYDTPESETYDGCCMAVIRAGEAAGEIHLTVTADDSVQKQLTILIQEAEC